jgi:lysophospholipase L1-like esterase
MVVASGTIMVALATLAFGIGEVAIRTIHLLRDGIPFFESTAGGRVGPITLDPELGWRATEHYEESLVETTKAGKPYTVRRSQKQYGFRQFGDPGSSRTKLLVIGDSFTHATAVSDDRTYHALLAKALDVEVFAYGVGGYGTLQEFLVFDRYIDTIRPDMILWQYCANDFINNDNELERLSLINNNGWIRPYWQNGRIRLLSPKESSLRVREWINRHSRFLYFIVSRLDRLRVAHSRDTVEVAIESEGRRHAGFLRAVGVTDELMGKVRARAGTRPIMAFNCVRDEPYDKAFQDISAHHGITYWDDVASVVRAADERGDDVYAADGGHWNEQGHQLVAEAIVRHFRKEVTTRQRP